MKRIIILFVLLTGIQVINAQNQVGRRHVIKKETSTTRPKNTTSTTTKKKATTVGKNSSVKRTTYTSKKQTSHTINASYSCGVLTVNGVRYEMVRVGAGTFTMGMTSEMQESFDFDEKPTHKVTLTKNYYMGKTEVTQALWKAVMGSNPSEFKGDNKPVECVSWDDCQTFIKKLNHATGKNFRLPTEAEWEFAARGGNKSRHYRYSGSNTLNDVAWYDSNSNDATCNVATKQPNELGLYDMSGNVREWCQDWYGVYNGSAQTNPTGPASVPPRGDRVALWPTRVNRGGAWYNRASYCRSSCRFSEIPESADSFHGLRLALSE